MHLKPAPGPRRTKIRWISALWERSQREQLEVLDAPTGGASQPQLDLLTALKQDFPHLDVVAGNVMTPRQVACTDGRAVCLIRIVCLLFNTLRDVFLCLGMLAA